MDQSILRSTKKILGIDANDDTFDLDIITFINSALSMIQQLGLGQGVYVQDVSTEWQEIVTDEKLLGLIRTIVYLRVRMLFDPPITSYTQQAMQSQIEELAWRLNVEREATDWVDPSPSEAA
jgi:hypothetical protein